jgi:MOSC domain-containing protein YiiM
MDAAVPAHVPVGERAPDRDFGPFLAQLEASPKDRGRLEGLVVRPTRETRQVVDEAVVDVDRGVVGDNWLDRGSSSTPDGSARLDSQVTLISTRLLAAIEPDESRWPLAGDQLYVDLDLSLDNLPIGARVTIGDVVLEVSPAPHTGCAKFSARFGSDALKWTNTTRGRELRMRGMNATVVRGGRIRVGDEIRVVRG